MNERPVEPTVIAVDDQDAVEVELTQWAELATRALTDEGIAGPAELDLTFVDRLRMTELNEQHMGGSGPTDVLSFPLDDDGAEVFEDQPRLLGDIVICPEVVVGQAVGDPDEEFALMVVHGVLHILGMDHAEPDEAERMRAAEQAHLSRWRKRSIDEVFGP